MRKFCFFSLVLSLVLTGSAVQMNYQLMKSKYADPTLMSFYTRSYPGWCYPFTAFIPEEGLNAVTVIWWGKTSIEDRDWSVQTEAIESFNTPFVQEFFTVRAARSSSEGGPELPNICSWDFDTSLTLSNGSWSQANLLPSGYAYQFGDNGSGGYKTEIAQYQYGIYAINIQTDSDLTLVVGGYEKQVSASPEKQVFNIACETADRSVSLSASSASATVKLGIAVNNLVEFPGSQQLSARRNFGGINNDRREGFCNLNTREYQMIVDRIRVLDTNTVVHQLSALASDIDYWQDTVTNKLDQPLQTPYFEKNARLSFSLGTFGGVSNKYCHVYGAKVFRGWLDDDFISVIRDLDVAEMKRRGISFPTDEDYWELRATTRSDYSSQLVPSGSYIEANSQVNYTKSEEVRSYTFDVEVSIKNGAYNITEITLDDVDLSCATAASQEGNVFHFSGPGTNTIQAVHKVTGQSHTVTVVLKSGNANYNVFTYTSDTANTPQAKCNNAVISKVKTATNNGTLYSATAWDVPFKYYKWQAKRIPVFPVKSTAGSQGHRSMGVLSPHTYYSATHYGWWVGGTETYVSEDNMVTSVVKTTSSMIKLSDWALANGFSSEEVSRANIGDIVVGRFTEGTVDPSCTPYLMSPTIASNYFGTANVLGWRAAQNQQGQGLPVLLNPNLSGNIFAGWNQSTFVDSISNEKQVLISGQTTTDNISGLVSTSVKNDLATLLSNSGTNTLFYARTYPGDSGLGIVLDPGDGKYILCSHHTSVGSGPSYTKGYEIVKAWIEANGDTVKTWNPGE